MNIGSFLILTCFIPAVLALLPAAAEQENLTVPRMRADFHKLGFGMFIHYNMATYHETQWVEGYPDPSTFDPGGKVDTDAWAEAAKAAGMKYGVLTAKHVAGFCLWDSEYTTYDVMHPDCPVQEDIVEKFIESFTSRGLKAGLYYCWRSPGFKGSFKVLPPECDPADHDLAEQVDFQEKQIAELVKKYPDAFYIWNDALDEMIMPAEEARAFFRGFDRPVLASSNWWDWGKKGTLFADIAIKETRHFPEDNAVPGETCWKLEQQWFWQQGARSRSAGDVLDHMGKARARNSNFLLNVGPDRRGRIIESSLETLAEIGRHTAAVANPLKAHGIFSSNMVLQRDKPMVIWGWADDGDQVSVRFGEEQAEATATGDEGRWEVSFPARGASADPHRLVITSGDETVEMENIVIGDVWVMNGQSNMAWSLGKTLQSDLESAQADLPLLRRVGISANERATLQTDIPQSKLSNGGWVEATPQTAGNFSAIGYNFGARMQRALQIPIGLIDNARGGASLESLVPHHKFDDHPLAKRYAESVAKRRAEFDWDAEVAKLVEKWERKVAEQRAKGVAEDKLPEKPTRASLRSWNIPGMSPSDAASCYNGMFGVFKGLNIKGVLFHQGYNNAMSANCRPQRYRVLMKLMAEGWREDFNDPELAVGVIGFCAGGIPQTRENFEVWSVAPAAYIREAQRLGLADLGDPEHTAFLPAYDVQIPGLHPHKKRAHGERAARWALNRVYDMKVNWDTATRVSAERDGDEMVLTFDKPVMPDDMSTIPKGFAIAGEDGEFYMARARFKLKKDVCVWNTANKSFDATTIHVWSPLVAKPVAVRYGWATSPMGNLKVTGKSWLPLASFRTDDWDWPESEDPTVSAVDRGKSRAMNEKAAERRESRRQREAEKAVEILERLKTLGRGSAG
jgi:sialate O-acetylesterase